MNNLIITPSIIEIHYQIQPLSNRNTNDFKIRTCNQLKSNFNPKSSKSL